MARHSQPVQTDTEEEEQYVYPILDGTDWREHCPGHEFCTDMSCPCHQDPDNLDELNEYYQEGLVSAQDADNIYRGKTLR